MTTRAKPPRPPQTTTGDLDAVLARMPPGRPSTLAIEALTLLFTNGLVLYFLVRGEMTPFELVILVAIEALLLSLLSRIQLLLVPRAARPQAAHDGRHPLGTLAFGLAWLAVVYFFVFRIHFDVGQEIAAAVADPLPFLTQPQILWPLLITLAGALIDAIGDHLHFRQHGGLFVSTPGFTGMARLLTLLLGAIPFVIPLLVLAIGISSAVKQWATRTTRGALPTMQSAMAMIFIVTGLLGAALAATVVGLLHLGVAGWAIGYVSAKLASEAMVLAIPSIAARIQAERRDTTSG